MIPKEPRFRLLLAVAIAALVITVFTVGLGPSEPTFQGKRLNFWLEQYKSNLIAGGDAEKIASREAAKSAVRQIGSNAIPHLLEMLRETDSTALRKCFGWLRDRRLGRYSKPAWARNAEAVAGFQVLGTEAKGAVSALVKIYDQNLSPSSRSAAAESLGAIGPAARAALPSLLTTALNSNDAARVYAIDALGQIHSDAGTVVPALINCLTDGKPGIRAVAARALGYFGSNAQQAIPELSKLLEDQDRSIRKAAEQAMRQICP